LTVKQQIVKKAVAWLTLLDREISEKTKLHGGVR
jgi:hypothetical protein